jgi:uncharacterized protein YlxP (DUF503 family)
VAEVGGQDTWQRAVLGLAVVGGDAQGIRSRLGAAVDFVESMHLAEVRDTDVEVLELATEDWNPDKTFPGGDPLPWEKE